MSSADASSSAAADANANANTTAPSSSSPPLSPAPTDPATTAQEWYKWYAAWISRFWPRIREEAKSFGLIPADYRSAVKPEMISSTDVSDAAIALCHYLVSAYEQVYAHYDLNAVHMQQYPVADWAYPELGYLDRSIKEAGGKSIVVLRMWLKDPGGNLRKNREVHDEKRVNNTMWNFKPFLPRIPDYWWALQGEQPPPPEEEDGEQNAAQENAGSADGGGGGETQQQKEDEGEDNQDMEMENAEN